MDRNMTMTMYTYCTVYVGVEVYQNMTILFSFTVSVYAYIYAGVWMYRKCGTVMAVTPPKMEA
jgi:hypothetical protein